MSSNRKLSRGWRPIVGSFARRKTREVVNCPSLHAHVTRDFVDARTMTTRTFVGFGRVNPFRFALSPQLVFQNRIAGLLSPRLKFLVPDFAEAAAFFARAMR